MKMNRMAALGLLIAAPLMAPAAHAEGLGAEVNYGRADGHWGTEIGAGYALDMAGFSLTPGGGVYRVRVVQQAAAGAGEIDLHGPRGPGAGHGRPAPVPLPAAARGRGLNRKGRPERVRPASKRG